MITLVLRCACKRYRLQQLQSLLVLAPCLCKFLSFEEIIAIVFEIHCLVELDFEVGGHANLVKGRSLSASWWLWGLIE